jgi:hypothetical protein
MAQHASESGAFSGAPSRRGRAKRSESDGIWALRYWEPKRQTASYSSSLLFGAAMAERDSERSGLLP